MGSVIGKAGAKIKEIQEASGARLQASEAMLPGSTERVLSVSGVADAIHIAVYYIGTVLLEHPTATGNTSYRPGSEYGAGGPVGGGSRPPMDRTGPPRTGGGGGGGGGMGPAVGPGAQSQAIFIPNELVGSIIGKGGAKINEVRQMSQCQIKINEPGEAAPGGGPNERVRFLDVFCCFFFPKGISETWPKADIAAPTFAARDHYWSTDGHPDCDPDAVQASRGGEEQACVFPFSPLGITLLPPTKLHTHHTISSLQSLAAKRYLSACIILGFLRFRGSFHDHLASPPPDLLSSFLVP